MALVFSNICCSGAVPKRLEKGMFACVSANIVDVLKNVGIYFVVCCIDGLNRLTKRKTPNVKAGTITNETIVGDGPVM